MADNSFTGRIIAVLPARSGVAKSSGNTWMSQEYVIEETHGQYPKRMCFNVFGEDKIKQFGIAVGQELKVSFDVNAREYQSKWYNDIRAWKVEPADAGAAPSAVQGVAPNVPSTAQGASGTPSATQAVPSAADIFPPNVNDDGLPF